MHITKKIIYGILLLSAALLVFCNRELPEREGPSAYLNLEEGVGYVGMQTCRSCHPNVYDSFINTGMGRSLGAARPQRSDATYGDHALVYDDASDLYYFPYFADSTLYVEEFRLQDGDTVHQRTEEIRYIIGSGHHTNSHIIDINGYIFQAPVTYYTQEGRWDLAPGFRGDNERFDRLLTTECITCHNHFPEHVAGSLNKYAEMPNGIECERCHGPGEVHAREKLAGNLVDTSRFIDYTIVNPRDLSRDLQMDLCQRCHLQGVAVLKEGKTFFDFKPGMRLHEVMNVFLPRYTNSHEKFIMASQADRLRLSPCYQQSEMTCITCHNPHLSVQATGDQQYNDACRSCHEGTEKTLCAAPAEQRQAEGDNCVHCHMPPSGSIDIPHVNITDHYLSRENIRGQRWADRDRPEGEPAFLGLQILTKEKASPLEMAQGYLALYDKYVSSPVMLDSAGYYLERSTLPPEEKLNTTVHYHFAREDYGMITGLAGNRQPATLDDGWTTYRIGEAYYRQQLYDPAVLFFQRATQLMPYDLDFQEKLGATYVNLQRLKEAEAAFQFVLQENPKRPVALSNLGFVYVLKRQFDRGETFYDRALELDPDYVQALLNKAAVRLHLDDQPTAVNLLRRVLILEPGHPQAAAVLREVEGRGL